MNSTKYLTKTIDDFRSFFLKNRSKKDFFIKKTIEKVLNLTSAKFKNKEINFIKDIEDLPIFGFENELLQVLINILNNAEDALILNDIKNKLIFINVYKKNNDCIIEIKDNANGIPQHIIEKVFEPYFTTKHKSQGTGIGLYMSQEIISKHMYGKIEVKNTNFFFENEQYYGALFKITLPLK
ncbi:sensor histidine kinase [Malaciobacter mytili]|uniref:sensor histidine kinase n=1 Tax=Malaciobacter mytili TaxID=603050 RepID=UPI003A88BFEA